MELEQLALAHDSVVTSVAFSPDGCHVISGSDDATIQIWDVSLGKRAGGPLFGHKINVTAVAFSPDGSRIVSGSWDKTIRTIWDTSSGNRLDSRLLSISTL